ncbi:MAG: D-alanyl-D-alanine carboxypeptidase [Coriobacteriales bacterium]|jgi:D-alanyl-D-alanine carboxypeptidase (penicillin-binding protein 5/6)|nr:D-alanyl-D-alanine carboxypeptidase [Coriobacteriales bacterium]
MMVVRIIIIVLICITMVSGLMLGMCTSAYGDQRPGDSIEGRPTADYAQVTTDIPDIAADYAALATREGRTLFQRDADAQMPMASTTKIMTAVVALENCELDKQMLVTVGAANVGGSEAGLEAGMSLPFSDALYAMMVPSGNDAAVVIAENIGSSEGKFVEMMNTKATDLGMTATRFADASGLSAEEHYTTANDYLKLTAYAMRIPLFREVVATRYKEIIVAGKVIALESTDKLFDVLEDGQALGVKTGFIDESGYCFVGAAAKGDIELYVVILHAPDDMQRFFDAATLLEWGFAHYRRVELLNSAQQVALAPLTSWRDKTVAVYIPQPVRVELLDLNGDIQQDISVEAVAGAVVRGQVVGQIVWEQSGEVLASSELVAAESVAAPDFWQGIEIWWQRLIGGFGGEPEHAEGSVLLPTSVPVPAAA